MHAALAIPEIVDEILTYCARPEASRLGRTCRVLFEPAMDIVWKEPSSDALRELLYAKNEGDTAPPLLPVSLFIRCQCIKAHAMSRQESKLGVEGLTIYGA
ncbi:hypothetical protein CALCODRAFT_328753 [Calocera cornea HHB12733]|uniref:F-box domain-containing protein n=1 Tax=Calocera cornea HHB12733 TaxID=1353952 RepID=A0A165JI70_9BASI|nr:hypothetical protein CALCODRAFT_328753 [Calocera cornea HHB12733]